MNPPVLELPQATPHANTNLNFPTNYRKQLLPDKFTHLPCPKLLILQRTFLKLSQLRPPPRQYRQTLIDKQKTSQVKAKKWILIINFEPERLKAVTLAEVNAAIRYPSRAITSHDITLNISLHSQPEPPLLLHLASFLQKYTPWTSTINWIYLNINLSCSSFSFVL